MDRIKGELVAELAVKAATGEDSSVTTLLARRDYSTNGFTLRTDSGRDLDVFVNLTDAGGTISEEGREPTRFSTFIRLDD